MSETAAVRHLVAPFCQGLGIDIGFGGDAVTPSVLTLDRIGGSYGAVGKDRQILQGDARSLGFLCNESLSFIYSSHLLEDFLWADLSPIITEWRRVLRPGGLLITCCPWEQKYREVCRTTGQCYNRNHQNADFGLDTWKANVIDRTGPWEPVFEEPNAGAYSFVHVVRKL